MHRQHLSKCLFSRIIDYYSLAGVLLLSRADARVPSGLVTWPRSSESFFLRGVAFFGVGVLAAVVADFFGVPELAFFGVDFFDEGGTKNVSSLSENVTSALSELGLLMKRAM